MSGGHFDYQQFHIKEIADQLREDIDNLTEEGSIDEKTLSEFKAGLLFLNLAYVYAQRIDWLKSGDDGVETFHERLKQDLEPVLKG